MPGADAHDLRFSQHHLNRVGPAYTMGPFRRGCGAVTLHHWRNKELLTLQSPFGMLHSVQEQLLPTVILDQTHCGEDCIVVKAVSRKNTSYVFNSQMYYLCRYMLLLCCCTAMLLYCASTSQSSDTRYCMLVPILCHDARGLVHAELERYFAMHHWCRTNPIGKQRYRV